MRAGIGRQGPATLMSDEKSLQALLTILGKFCEDWGLVVNLKKTKILTFTRSGRLLQPKSPLKIGESTIEATKSYTYLGIMITPNFNLKLEALKAIKIIGNQNDERAEFSFLSNAG